jgi:hypothetical protein
MAVKSGTTPLEKRPAVGARAPPLMRPPERSPMAYQSGKYVRVGEPPGAHVAMERSSTSSASS